jgi:hypothetical protein
MENVSNISSERSSFATASEDCSRFIESSLALDNHTLMQGNFAKKIGFLYTKSYSPGVV